MNAKLCKAMRRQARERTVGKLDRQLLAVKSSTLKPDLTAVNDPDTTRGYYRMLKRSYRAFERHTKAPAQS